VAFDKMIQDELIKVGCYSGPADGALGPETDAAILKFQSAAGLSVDGELGPLTDGALKADAAEGKTVCSALPTATPTPTQSPSGASCTATALSTALKSGEKLLSFICTDVSGQRWAAGSQSAGPDVANFFAKANGSTWVLVPNDEVCGTASAGLPEDILKFCGLTQ